MHEIYMNSILRVLLMLALLLAHGYVLVRLGVSPALVLSLMWVGGIVSLRAQPEQPVAPAQVKPAAPVAPMPAPAKQPQPLPK